MMANIREQKSHSAIVTPTEGSKFKFPPDVCASADRLRDISNFYFPANSTRRSFTPLRSALFMKSPEFSPIELTSGYNFKRVPPEKVRKAPADSTSLDATDENVARNEDFILMPPPPRRRKPAGPDYSPFELELRAAQRRIEPYYVEFHHPVPIIKTASSSGQKKPRRNVRFPNDILNAPISLKTLLKDTGLGKYVEIFDKEEIDLEILLFMSEHDLTRIGIDKVEDRTAILNFKNIFDPNYN